MRRTWLEPLIVAATVMLVVLGVASLNLGSAPAPTEKTAQTLVGTGTGSATPAADPSSERGAGGASATTTTRAGSKADSKAGSRAGASSQPREGSADVPAATAIPAAQVDAQVASRSKEITSLAQQAEAHTKKLRQAETAAGSSQFRIAVFNILGSNHTGRGDSAAGYASGRTRAGWANGVIRDFGLDVIGFSEIQGDQLGVVSGGLGNYDFYPGTSLGNKGVPTNLAWRSDKFAMVDSGTVNIPFVGQTRPMPYVRLKDTGTGGEFWVMNAHNAPQGRQRERDAALAVEKAKLRDLLGTGIPVFFIGDLNEKGSLFCKVVGDLPFRAANGGSAGNGCSPPAGMRVDWIFGSSEHVDFSGYDDNKSGAVRRITDHALVMADASVQ